MDFFDLDTASLVDATVALAAAFALSLPVAWNRERGTQLVGLRTLPLVAVASCGYVLIGRSIAGDNADALSRIIQGLITGIGFVGGGAIVKSTEEVKGTSTAAAIWATGAIGAAAAWGRVGLAAALALITYLTFLLLTPVRQMIKEEEERGGSG